MDRGARFGVDVGSVRVGLAASDADGMLATPVATAPREDSVRQIMQEIGERSAHCVYVGLPRHLSGAEGAAAQAARVYAEQLAQAITPVPVYLVDERLSTTIAHQSLRQAGRSTRKHRSVVDQVAAVVILQGALDVERTTGHRAGEPVRVNGGSDQQGGGLGPESGDAS